MHMKENEKRGSWKTQTKMSGCYMTNTEVEMLQEDKEEKEDNKKEKRRMGRIRRRQYKHNICKNSVSHRS